MRNRGEFTLQVWLVLLLESCRNVGLVPVEKRVFHRIVYLSNCLAPLFEAVPSISHLVKYRRGPFYPRVQNHLDHLAVCQVINLTALRYERDAYGRWMEAKYSIGDRGRDILAAARQVEYGRRLKSYLAEIIASIASLDHQSWEKAALLDHTYNAPGRSDGFFIDFEDEKDNLSVQTAESFKTVMPQGVFPTAREELYLYLKLLEQLTKEAA